MVSKKDQVTFIDIDPGGITNDLHTSSTVTTRNTLTKISH